MAQAKHITHTKTLLPTDLFDVSALLKTALTSFAATCKAQNLNSGAVRWEFSVDANGNITFTASAISWPASNTLADTGI